MENWHVFSKPTSGVRRVAEPADVGKAEGCGRYRATGCRSDDPHMGPDHNSHIPARAPWGVARF
jgi:hypothetical protein